MARHLFDASPSIFVEERSLVEILEAGIAPLISLRGEVVAPEGTRRVRGHAQGDPWTAEGQPRLVSMEQASGKACGLAARQ